jgi:hypothetical protein
MLCYDVCRRWCYKIVTRVLQEFCKGATRVFRDCYKSITTATLQNGQKQLAVHAQDDSLPPVTRVLQGCYKGVTRVLQGRCKGVTRYYESVARVLQGCYKGVTRVLQGCYKCVTRVLQECYSTNVNAEARRLIIFYILIRDLRNVRYYKCESK